MAISNLHQSIVAGAAGAGGATPFDTTLIGNSVWLDGSADFFKRDNKLLGTENSENSENGGRINRKMSSENSENGGRKIQKIQKMSSENSENGVRDGF